MPVGKPEMLHLEFGCCETRFLAKISRFAELVYPKGADVKGN